MKNSAAVRTSRFFLARAAASTTAFELVPTASLWGKNALDVVGLQQQQRQQLQQQQQRTLATTKSGGKSKGAGKMGTRGARGHGWYVNYRAGKGGRHLKGEYHDRDSLEASLQWNDAVLQLGSTRVYMDVAVEPQASRPEEADTVSTVTTAVTSDDNGDAVASKKVTHNKPPPPGVYIPPLDQLSAPKQRLIMDIASTVMPETCDNFVKLCRDGYPGSLLYRFEKKVGVCGGDVLTNTGSTGRAAVPTGARNPTRLTIPTDPLAMWHLPGTVTMTVASVDEVDSRFMLCTQTAPHLDGIHRAFGRLTAESLDLVTSWQEKLLTRDAGVPSSYHIVIVDAGVVVDDDDGQSAAAGSADTNETQEAGAAA